MSTIVVFRKYSDGEVIALFPEARGSNAPGTCDSYTHNGQHAPAHYAGVIRSTKPTGRGEHLPLLAELRRIGYSDLEMRRKRPARHGSAQA